MTRDEAVIVMMRKLSFRTGIEANCITALQTAQRQLESQSYLLPNGMRIPYPSFLIETDSELTLVADQEYIDLPTDFLGEVEDMPPYMYNIDEKKVFLAKSSPGVLREAYPGSAEPVAYYQQDTRLYLAPAPDDAYLLYLSYYKAEPLLTSNVENKWLEKAPDLIIGIAGEELAGDYRDKAAQVEFQRLITMGATMIWQKSLNEEYSNRRTAIGVVR